MWERVKVEKWISAGGEKMGDNKSIWSGVCQADYVKLQTVVNEDFFS